MNWTDLAAALALYLVLEGITPFLNPQGMKRLMQSIANLGDGHLRIAGFVSMACGIALLYLVRG
jgi:uncharacterized protein YjeT (DUF2065 family)